MYIYRNIEGVVFRYNTSTGELHRRYLGQYKLSGKTVKLPSGTKQLTRAIWQVATNHGPDSRQYIRTEDNTKPLKPSNLWTRHKGHKVYLSEILEL